MIFLNQDNQDWYIQPQRYAEKDLSFSPSARLCVLRGWTICTNVTWSDLERVVNFSALFAPICLRPPPLPAVISSMYRTSGNRDRHSLLRSRRRRVDTPLPRLAMTIKETSCRGGVLIVRTWSIKYGRSTNGA